MRFSIVTPSYNQARFLEQTIRSVLDPAHPPYEYFVMDGGSTDSSVEIIKKYAGQLTAWVSEKDKGQADAINKGLSQASGDIVAWLNSDDFYMPGALEKVRLAFEQNPRAGLVYGNVLSVNAEGKSFNLQVFHQIGLLDLMTFHIISQPAVFMRRAMLDQVGLLDPSYHCLLDHHLWLRMARIAPVVYIPETLAAARYHAEAKNVARTAEFGREAFRIVDWMQSNHEFSELFEQNKAKILGGVNRFDAFYLVDGGKYRSALAAYWRAFKFSPPTALKDWHRVIYIFLAMLGLQNLRSIYMRLRKSLKNQ
ncbi:MAG TPA: glycosyltransferase family 2 protein [Anaerolineales bacterium]|jgi:glycosyltransferase involved in cell wall biosynthesis